MDRQPPLRLSPFSNSLLLSSRRSTSRFRKVEKNLGEVLHGDRIENSVYSFKMREEQMCQIACRVELDAEAAKNFKEKIDDEYQVNMILDNLPVAVLRQRRDGNPAKVYEHGFCVGFKGKYSGMKIFLSMTT
ncbi:hypothetical protein Nepgr_015572 [Nepenthes gracilis]|uniref:Transmembrane 9 superfamily member n=1 Tax=Nepenthes gracilis TaxID=150966 RepID=A0AAD3SNS3_NEPGR|nr:hypothetical protein Nepgr_015572 [Nepenthes gracilis]